MSDLAQWLNWAAEQHKQAIKLDLSRITKVGQCLGVLEAPCEVITVAGTNGKGSTVATITAIAVAANKKIGSFTSPHLLQFNERIAINGQPCSDATLCEGFSAVEKAIIQCEQSLTFFEIATLVALYVFQQQSLDLWVLEVGLGGRLDAVNCVAPDVAVITSIDLDHQQYLGNTREAIGSEKAGIIRYNKPIIYGEQDIPQSVKIMAQKKNAPLLQWGRDFFIEERASEWVWQEPVGSSRPLPISLGLPQNVACGLMALQCLSLLNVPWSAIVAGVAALNIPGRWQHFRLNHVLCYVDVAHNVAAVRTIAHRLHHHEGHDGVWRAVFSSMADKDIGGMVTLLKPFIHSWHVAALDSADSHQRQATLAQLKQALNKAKIERIHCSAQLSEAFKQVLACSEPGDRVLVFGSFHTVAALLKIAGIETVSQLSSVSSPLSLCNQSLIDVTV
ncbi:MAG: bifunctional folylpolyglutamate synthase/dihydrofolate synthase [Gammaproteobacteria bacterium]